MKGKGLLVFALLGSALLLGACLGPGNVAVLTVQFTGMEPNVGQRFEVRLFEQSGGEVGRRVLDSIPSATFSLEFAGVNVGSTYRLGFFADVNGNSAYDAPPTDDAWELVVVVSSDAETVVFVRTGTLTDIGWSGNGPSTPAIDGVIEDGEYAHSFTDPGIDVRVYWRNTQTTLTVGMISPGTGWVAVGFDATNVKEDANIIMAAVSGGQLAIEDQFGTGPYSHGVDAEQNILESAGRESGGQTIVEFTIPLDSGDSWDKALQPGSSYPLLLAYNNSSDDMTRKHSAASTVQFTLDP